LRGEPPGSWRGALERAAAAIADVALCRITGDDIISVRFQNEMLLETIDAADGAAFSSA
jgi:hypothetical protein